jgi:DNA-binding response OmpR family regulator
VILVYGNDPVLLQTRQWVLERGNFEVVLAETPAEVESILHSRTIPLLILCRSLSLEDCRTAFAIVEAQSAQTQRLLLQSSFSQDLALYSHEVLDPFDGPMALIDMAKKLTGQARTAAAHV